MKTEYLGVRLWGKMLASFDYYIDGQIKKAIADNAPIDAIYYKGCGNWITVKDLDADHPFRIHYYKTLKGN